MPDNALYVPAGVAAVITHPDGRVLLGRRLTSGAGLLGLPGGRLEPGESLSYAVRREVREETGLDPVSCKNVLRQMFSESHNPARDRNYWLTVYFHMPLLSPVKTVSNLEPTKCEGWDWFDVDHLKRDQLFGSDATWNACHIASLERRLGKVLVSCGY